MPDRILRLCAPGSSHTPSAWQIFNKQGVCLYYREWNRPVAASDVKQDQKLMFGFLFSLKQLVAKMSPKKCAPAPPVPVLCSRAQA